MLMRKFSKMPAVSALVITILIILFTQASCFAEDSADIAYEYENIAKAAEENGDLETAAEWYSALLPYAEDAGLWDCHRVSEAKALQYASRIDVYTDGGDKPYYGAKFEPLSGVLFGSCSDSSIRKKLKNESMILLYHELGEPVTDYKRAIFTQARLENTAVEMPLNCLNEADDIENITKYADNLSEIVELLNEFSDVPVFIRFGGEFDVWENQADADAYITAYRYVSDFIKSRCKNAAMVWNPDSASAWYTDFRDFYPGDEYVDWIGISHYCLKYFLASAESSTNEEIVFKTGINADPVLAIKHIVDEYGDRKPIMLSESGQVHHTYGDVNEDSTEWAVQKMREMYYYIPMVYPQVKLIAYFDHFTETESIDMSLENNEAMADEYLSLTKTARFIQDNYENSAELTYRKVEYGTVLGKKFLAAAYSHIYNEEIEKVEYYIDGKLCTAATEIPYAEYIDASDLSAGEHTLNAISYGSGGKTVSTDIDIIIDPSIESAEYDNIYAGTGYDGEFNPIFYLREYSMPYIIGGIAGLILVILIIVVLILRHIRRG